MVGRLGGVAPFKFWFGDLGGIQPNGAVHPRGVNAWLGCETRWEQLTGPQPKALMSVRFCGILLQLENGDGTLTRFRGPIDGTITTTSDLDRVGNGTVTMRLDAVTDAIATEVTPDLANARQQSIHVDAIGLTGIAVFSDVEISGPDDSFPTI